MRRRVLARRFQQGKAAIDIRPQIGGGILQRVPHAGLRGQMQDQFGPLGREQRVKRARRLEPRNHRHKAVFGLQHRVPGALQRRIVIIGQRVEADHPMAAGQQVPGAVKADEPGRTGHKNGRHLPRPLSLAFGLAPNPGPPQGLLRRIGTGRWTRRANTIISWAMRGRRRSGLRTRRNRRKTR